MKPRFAKMKLVELIFLLLWLGAFISAQSTEPFRESKTLSKTTIITRVRPSVVVGTVTSSRTSQPKATSKMSSPKTQAIVRMENSLSIKATRAFSNSSMTATPTTLASSTGAPMRGEDSNLGLIIACVVAGIVVLVLVSLVLHHVKRRRKRRPLKYNSRRENCRYESSVRMNYDADLSSSDRFAEAFLGRYLIGARPSSVPTTERAVFYDDIAEDDTDITFSAKEPLTRNTSTRPGLAKDMITTKGGVIQIDDIILTIGEGCLEQDTEITLMKDDQNYDFNLLLKLGLLDAPPRVVEFLPDGLKFLKPADLRIRFEKPVNDSELFVLHGSYNQDYQRRVWELVTNDIVEINRVEGFVDMKIHGFSFYTYIISCFGWLARILSHLNHSFSCSACVLYRRVPSTSTSIIDVAVVICSEFVEKDGEVEQVNCLIANGYTKGEHGTLAVVDTDRSLKMFVDFPDLETSGFEFKLQVQLLDTSGYVVSHSSFMGITTEKPATGLVRINEIQQNHEEEKSLWTIRVCEVEAGQVPSTEKLSHFIVEHRSTPPELNEETISDVLLWSTRLSNPEISRLSELVGMDWDSLAGLMDIPYNKREEIRFDATICPDPPSKARRIFQLFNVCVHFGRHNLKKCFQELGRHDLQKEITFEEGEFEQATPPSPDDVPVNEKVQLQYTALSSRETYRLSRCIARDWNRLAGLMGIAQEDTDNIQNNVMYHDNRSRAEKILSIFNLREGFSRGKLVEHLVEMRKLEWTAPVLTGEWRKL